MWQQRLRYFANIASLTAFTLIERVVVTRIKKADLAHWDSAALSPKPCLMPCSFVLQGSCRSRFLKLVNQGCILSYYSKDSTSFAMFPDDGN